ncbi:MAG TPA: hypothetical protein VJ810_07870 [Blastocatellia bacterium]|nr:hypothetical protein [Blastocatellia bacterium]
MVQIAQGAINGAYRQPCPASIAVEVRLLRIDRYGAVVIYKRAIQVALLLPRQPAIVPGIGVSRVQLDRAISIGQSL